MNREIEKFFEEYAQAMLGKDYEKEVLMYEYPAAIFSEIGVRLVEGKDLLEFFRANEDYYENYTAARPMIKRVTFLSPKQLMAEVVWRFTASVENSSDEEAYVYILNKSEDSYKILGVLMMHGIKTKH